MSWRKMGFLGATGVLFFTEDHSGNPIVINISNGFGTALGRETTQ
jgi:hypothetical protein